MPVKAEAEPVMASVVAPEAVALASSEMLTEEENDALNQISQRYEAHIFLTTQNLHQQLICHL
jgi:hypothetical protein